MIFVRVLVNGSSTERVFTLKSTSAAEFDGQLRNVANGDQQCIQFRDDNLPGKGPLITLYPANCAMIKVEEAQFR